MGDAVCRPGNGSFNEAAGIPRGRPPESAVYLEPACASMRPRVFPAEDAVDYFRSEGFNGLQ